MNGNNVKIIQTSSGATRVFIDGVEVKGVTAVKYSINSEENPVIKLEFISNTLNFDGGLKLQVNLDGEKLVDEVIKGTNEKSRRENVVLKI